MSSSSRTDKIEERTVSSSLAATSVLLTLVALFLLVFLRTAWVCDDAYITFRTVSNLWNGYGLTWNTVERVQVYTHPFWMFLVAGLYGLGHEVYFTVLALSAFCSLAALAVLIFCVAETRARGILLLTILLLSRAFVDYSSSGLENPLTHLLLALFAAAYLGRLRPVSAPGVDSGSDAHPLPRGSATRPRPLTHLFLIAGFALFNRMDTILLFLPALAIAFWASSSPRRVLSAVVGMAPFLVWELFSLYYYGFPFPNTAYAKLWTGIDAAPLLEQGGRYFRDSLMRDPLTLAAIGAGIVIPFVLRNRKLMPFSAGIVLYLVYVARIGGDFMSGRFFTAPLLVSAIVLATTPIRRKSRAPALAISSVVLLGFLGDTPTVLCGSRYGDGFDEANDSGVIDERGMYYRWTGLLRSQHPLRPPDHPWIRDGLKLRRDAEAGGPRVVIRFSIGMPGYVAGPDVYLVDVYALADPLLARLRANKRHAGFRIGHFARWIPGGYIDSLRTGKVLITNRDLARYYDKLMQVIRGPLFSLRRLKEIWFVNAGAYDPWLDAYRDPPRWRVALEDIDHSPPPDETRWDATDVYVLSERGMVIETLKVCRARWIELSLDRNDDYRIAFLHDGLEVSALVVERLERTRRGLTTRQLAVPEPARREGFDEIEVVPLDGDLAFSLGHLRVLSTDQACR